MRYLYPVLVFFLLPLHQVIYAQCPPPGFPSPGNTCPQAPILCENLDGYCATINNNNVVQNFPGCPNNVLNNDEWFAFFAGSTTITIVVTPTNCAAGGNQGLQGGIYGGCISQIMDTQCPCSTNPFTLTSSNYVVGQVYWFVLDGCAGNVCDFSIDVTVGSTVGVAPPPPGPVTAPDTVCVQTSSTVSVAPVEAATIYNWTVTPTLGTPVGTNPSANINWGNTPGTAQVCVQVENLCYENLTQSCTTVVVIPKPTATLSGSGVLCGPGGPPVNLTVNFTGAPPWTFTYTIGGVAQPPITTSTNPYTLQISTPGAVNLTSVNSPAGPGCSGTVSGSVNVVQSTINLSSNVTGANCGLNSGAIDLTVAPPNGTYTYNWSNQATSQDLTNLVGGTYNVTVTDQFGCTQSAQIPVADNTININVSGNATANTTCNGGNGSISINVNPASPPVGSYTYLWSNGASTTTINNLTPGTYTVTVTAGTSCTGTASFTVPDQPNTPNISQNVTNANCGLSNGGVNLSVSGGVSPYTFAWSGGQTSEDLSNIPGGSYTVTVTGANGCTSTSSINVPDDVINFTINGTPNANTTCNGGNGSISINVTPANPPSGAYTYAWSNGATNTTLNNLTPGNYTVTVTTGNTCSQIATFNVPDQPNQPQVSPNITAATCGQSNGNASLTVSGGVSPFTYNWSNGSTSSSIANVPGTSYTVTVTGANGCTTVTNVNIPDNPIPVNLNAAVLSNTTCNGGNGSINLTIAPPGNPYDILWSNGSTMEDLSNLTPGSYTVTVTTGSTCTAIQTFTVNDDPNEPVLNTNFTPASCGFSNGNIDLQVSGGVSPYTFSWSNGAVTEDLVNQAGNTSYSVTVTGANGCSSSTSVTVPDNPFNFTVSAVTIQNTACSTSNGIIDLNVNPSSPPNGSYTFNWSNGSMLQDLTGLTGGTYTVTVSAGGTCTEVASFTIENIPDEPNAVFIDSPANCGLPNGSLTVSVNGGVQPFTFNWSTGSVGQTLNNIAGGSYTVTITGANGCSTVASYTLPNDDIPISIASFVDPNSNCGANGNGAITISVEPANATIVWSNGSNGGFVGNLLPGPYSVTVSAGGNCTETEVFNVPDISEAPTLSYDITPATCGSLNGQVDLTVETPYVPYEVTWSNGFPIEDLLDQGAGSYSVTVTTSAGCTGTASLFIPDNDVPFDIQGFVDPNTSCANPNGVIVLDVYPFEAYLYQWSTGQSSSSIATLTPGNYTVTVTLGNDCIQSATFEVPNAAIPPNVSTSSVAATCGTPNGSATVTASGGTTPYTYLWSNSAATSTISNIAPGNYTVTVTDGTGCTNTASVSVANNNLALNATAAVTANTSCTTGNGALNLTVSPAGTYNYAWSNSAMTEDLSNLATGSYTVTVTQGQTCSTTATFQVTANTSNPTLAETISPAICNQPIGSISLVVTDATTPYTYTWSNSGGNSPSISDLAPGNYSVTVTGGNGCSSTATYNVSNQSNTFSISGVAFPDKHCIQETGSVDLTVTPPGNYTIAWSNGSTTEDIANLAPGTHTVSVTAAGDCTATASFIVEDSTSFPTASQVVVAELCGLLDGGVDLTVSGGSAPYNYTWSNSATTQDLTGIAAGSYDATVTGANGCTTTVSATVPANNLSFSINGTTATNTSCGVNNGGVSIDVTPAGNYTYLWSNASTNEDLNALPGGTYSVTVSAGGTCTNVASFTVNDITLAPILGQNIQPSLCAGTNGGIDLSVSGSEAPYVFAWSNNTTSEDLTGIASGNYSVTVTGGNGCVTVNSFVVPDNVFSPVVNGTPSPNTSCAVNNGGVSIMVNPATPGAGLSYTYEWSTNATTPNINNVPSGSYTVTVSAGGGCTSETSFTVPSTTEDPILSPDVTPAICGVANGNIDLNVSGAIAPYTFDWSTNETSEDIATLLPGDYSVTVVGANGCQSVASVTVPDSQASFSIAGTATSNSNCFTPNGQVGINVSPSTPASGFPYVFNWSNNATTEDLANLSAGDYSVTVSQGSSCETTASFTVGDVSPSVTLDGVAQDIKCFGENNGSIDLHVSGGVLPYEFVWSPQLGDIEDPSSLPPGDYSVTVTEQSDCSASLSFTITQPATGLALQCAQAQPVSLPGMVDGIGGVNIIGGTAPYTVDWNPGGSQGNVNAGNFTIGSLAEGSYQVNVTDANGCPAACNFNITPIDCGTKVGTMPDDLNSRCGAGCLSGIYNDANEFLDSNDVVQFILHEGNGGQIVNEIARNNQPSFCFDASLGMVWGVTYYISAVAGNGDPNGNVVLSDFCTVVSLGMPVLWKEQPTATILTPDPLNCAVTQTPLEGSSTVASSVFTWTTNNGQINGSTAQATAQAGSAGTYTLVVDASGCKDTVQVQVADLSNVVFANITFTPSDILDCQISQITLAGAVEGSSNAGIVWLSNGQVFTNNNPVPIDNPGIYVFVALDTFTFCSDTASIEIDENLSYPPLDVATPGLLTCVETLVTLNGSSSFPGILFNWATVSGTDTTIIGSGANLPVTTPGTYFFLGEDPVNHCMNAISVTVNADLDDPVADAGEPFSIYCFGETALLDGSGSTGDPGLTYLWTTNDGELSGNETSAQPTIELPGTYVLLVTNPGNGCTDEDEVLISPETPIASIHTLQPPCFGDKGAIAIDSVIGGAPFKYSIDGGETFTTYPIFTKVEPGEYELLIVDGGGCTATVEAEIIQPVEFNIEIEPEAVLKLGDSYQIETQVSVPLDQVQSVTWTPGTWLSCDTCLNPIATPESTILYQIRAVNEKGCEDTEKLLLVVDKRVDVFVPNAFSPNGDGTNDMLTIFADPSVVVNIKSFLVFSRWGETVYEYHNFLPNDPAAGWDGKHRGETMNPAVFAWFAEVELVTGRVMLFEGDVTLMR